MIHARSLLDLARTAADELTRYTGGHRLSDQTRQIDTGQLWKSVDQLTLDRRQRLVRQIPGTKARVEYVEIPSLWTQLLEATASTGSGGGRGKASTGSRSPVDLAIEALLIEISRDVTKTLREQGHQPRFAAEYEPVMTRRAAPPPALVDEAGVPLFDPDLAGRLVERAARAAANERAARDVARHQHDTRSDLRQLATVIVSTRDDDLIGRWTDRYRSWVARAQTALTADDESVDTRGVRGHACPTCQTLWVTSERDGETYREPALVIAFRDGQVLHITCRACATGWWRGTDVDALTRQLALHTAVRGPAESWGTTVPRPERGSRA